MSTIHLCLDETGDFTQGQRSAIGGLWTPHAITPEDARAFWHETLGKPLEGVFHGAEAGHDLHAEFARALAAFERRGWNAIVIEHASRQTVVDNATTYVNVFAEGICKFGRRRAARAKALGLDILTSLRHAPRDGQPCVTDTQKIQDYTSRLAERIQTERLRAPRPIGEAPWTYQLQTGNAKQDPRLMIADLVCTAWSRLDRLPTELQAAWRAFLAPDAFQVLRADDTERITLHLDQDEHAMALMTLLPLLVQQKSVPHWLKKSHQDVLSALADLDGDTRDAVLHVPLSRIRTAIEVHRDYPTAERLLHAWRTAIFVPLREKLPAEEAERLDWAAGEALSYAVLIGNHRGAALDSEAALAEFASLKGKLASRFERLPLALNMRVYRGVHLSNVYAFHAVLTDLAKLSETLEGLLDLMKDLEASETDRLRSDLHGRTLGTRLQAAMMAGRRDPACFETARALSEHALVEFERPDDRRRQEGYRAQLETDAGNLTEAHRWLARSAGVIEDTPPRELAEAACKSRFSVMHLTRLWEAAARHGDHVLASALAEAWDIISERLAGDLKEASVHPLPVILWKAGAAMGQQGRQAQGLTLLVQAIEACDRDPAALTVRTVGLGAACDRLAVLQEVGDTAAMRNAVAELQGRLKEILKPAHPAPLVSYFETWPSRVEAAAKAGSPSAWRALAWDIPY